MIISFADALKLNESGRSSCRELPVSRCGKGFPTGLTEIDRWTGGLMPGRIHVLAARPGAGLSSVLRTMVSNVVSMNLEETPEENVTTFFFTQVDDVRISAARIHEAVSRHAPRDENERTKDPLEEKNNSSTRPDTATFMADYHLAFGVTEDLVEIIGEILVFRALHPDRRLLVILDRPSFVGRSTPLDWAYAGSQLLHLAKTANVAVVVGTLLSKRVDFMNPARQSRPSLADVDDFGQVVENSEVVMAISRRDYYDIDSIDRGLLALNLIRNHEGKLGAKRFVFLPERSMICNLIELPEEMFNGSEAAWSDVPDFRRTRCTPDVLPAERRR